MTEGGEEASCYKNKSVKKYPTLEPDQTSRPEV